MIKADQHMHTSFSGDASEAMEAMAQAALEKGLDQICITDHMDIGYPERWNEAAGRQENIFLFDVPAYQKACRQTKERYQGKLDICCGIELGLTAVSRTAIQALLAVHSFDFVIGSSHLIGTTDPYYPDFWELHTEQEGLRLYFGSIIENIKLFDNFDSYGHLDYIVRYTPVMNAKRAAGSGTKEPFSAYAYADYADHLDEILRLLITRGKALEVNTAGYKYGLGSPNPQAEVLKRYRELGGELITIGSDAHVCAHIAYGFTKAEELLMHLGFRYYTVYRSRTPHMLKL